MCPPTGGCCSAIISPRSPGPGPLVGPVLATQMGYLPCSIWIIVGAVFAGAVQDYLVLWISTRRRGRSLGQMARDELGAIGGAAAIVGVLRHHGDPLAVLALVVVRALAESPWGVFSIAMTIPIAIFMGCYLRFLRPGRVSEVSVIGCRAADARRGVRRCGRRNSLGRILVQLVAGDGVVADHRLRIRRVGAAGVAAARAARLPVDVHEGRHHRPAGDRHLHGPPGHAAHRRSRASPPTATDRCSPGRCSRSCSSPSRAARCPDSTR